MRARPTVSVIVPFAGSALALDALIARLGTLALREGDEVIVADNRPGPAVDRVVGTIRLIVAAGVRSPAFARNRAAAMAHGEWLVMIDADTVPTHELLDAYFTPAPDEGTAVLAGGITDSAPPGSGLAGERSARRGHMSQLKTLNRGAWSYAQSANVAVRREAFEQVGGFDPMARAAEDADLCFRLAAAGWGIESREHAAVFHLTRDSVIGLLRQLARHGSGASWAQRRHPGSFPPPTPRAFAGRLAWHLRNAARARHLWQIQHELLGLLEACAFEGGRLLSNEPRGAGQPRFGRLRWPGH